MAKRIADRTQPAMRLRVNPRLGGGKPSPRMVRVNLAPLIRKLAREAGLGFANAVMSASIPWMVVEQNI